MSDLFDNATRKFWEVVDNFANSTAGNQSQQENSEHLTEKQEDSKPWYAEWNEDYLSTILNNTLTRKCLRSIADDYYAGQVDEIVARASLLTEETHPMLYRIYKECVDRLKMKDCPNLYITNRIKGINALSVETKGRKIILLGLRTSVVLDRAELQFVIGHELGHHQQGNLVCHTVNGLMNNMVKNSEIFGPMLLDVVEVPLKRWCRQSEFNADRAGYICCQDIDAIKNLFIKLGMIEKASAYGLYKQMGEDHPMLKTRYDRLLEYFNKLMK